MHNPTSQLFATCLFCHLPPQEVKSEVAIVLDWTSPKDMHGLAAYLISCDFLVFWPQGYLHSYLPILICSLFA